MLHIGHFKHILNIVLVHLLWCIVMYLYQLYFVCEHKVNQNKFFIVRIFFWYLWIVMISFAIFFYLMYRGANVKMYSFLIKLSLFHYVVIEMSKTCVACYFPFLFYFFHAFCYKLLFLRHFFYQQYVLSTKIKFRQYIYLPKFFFWSRCSLTARM